MTDRQTDRQSVSQTETDDNIQTELELDFFGERNIQTE